MWENEREGGPTEAEQEALACMATGHEPQVCDCNDTFDDERYCWAAQETFKVVERIIAARIAARTEAADRERAKAWDEGWAARAEYDARRAVPLDWPDLNPYRAAAVSPEERRYA